MCLPLAAICGHKEWRGLIRGERPENWQGESGLTPGPMCSGFEVTNGLSIKSHADDEQKEASVCLPDRQGAGFAVRESVCDPFRGKANSEFARIDVASSKRNYAERHTLTQKPFRNIVDCSISTGSDNGFELAAIGSFGGGSHSLAVGSSVDGRDLSPGRSQIC
jgi:hypothetical protein